VKVAVTGYGRAEKIQVMRMVQRLLGLVAPPPSDEADALAVAVCHGLSLRGPARGTAARGPLSGRALDRLAADRPA
jgi:crossover junction endodeoxyribonuclease RuvC